MDQFDDVLTAATAALAPGYFRLPVHGTGPVFRERVYCYELYHQMRRRWPRKCNFVLNGEVDKQRHPYFLDHRHPKPDFLVHVPGTGENYAVIEVKPPGADADEIRNDISKLAQFREWYERAIYLHYGLDPDEARNRIAVCAEDQALLVGIELWVHPQPGVAAARVDRD